MVTSRLMALPGDSHTNACGQVATLPPGRNLLILSLASSAACSTSARTCSSAVLSVRLQALPSGSNMQLQGKGKTSLGALYHRSQVVASLASTHFYPHVASSNWGRQALTPVSLLIMTRQPSTFLISTAHLTLVPMRTQVK